MGTWDDSCAASQLSAPGLVREEPEGLYPAEQTTFHPAMKGLAGHGYPWAPLVGQTTALHPRSCELPLPRRFLPRRKDEDKMFFL